jgi:hypothetical protein
MVCLLGVGKGWKSLFQLGLMLPNPSGFFPTVFPTSEIIIGVQNGMSKGNVKTDFIVYSGSFKTRQE